MSEMRVLYLDQNKWIELARCVANPEAYPEVYAVLERLVAQVQGGCLTVPLSFANIYETHKINKAERRSHLAWVQATLSQGWVFRSRSAILRSQIADHLNSIFSLAPTARDQGWFLSNIFFEAAAEYDPTVFGFAIPEKVLSHMRENPQQALFSYLTSTPEQVRLDAVRKYSYSSRELISQIHKRQEVVRTEPMAMRRRVYGAQLLIDHLDMVFEVAAELSVPLRGISDLRPSDARNMISRVPAFDVERELAVRVDSEDHILEENDLRDLLAFTVVVPYADLVIAEKAFTNRAKQAGLEQRYQTQLLSSLVGAVL